MIANLMTASSLITVLTLSELNGLSEKISIIGILVAERDLKN